MKRYVEGEDRNQATLLPDYLDDYIAEDNPVRAVDAFVEELDLKQLGLLALIRPRRAGQRTTRRCYSSSTYGYLNHIAAYVPRSRFERRHVECLHWRAISARGGTRLGIVQ